MSERLFRIRLYVADVLMRLGAWVSPWPHLQLHDTMKRTPRAATKKAATP